MSETGVLIGVGIVFAVFILFFLLMRMALSRGRADGPASVAGDGGGLESGHDWHLRQQGQFHGDDNSPQDHGGSWDSGSSDSGGGGGGD